MDQRHPIQNVKLSFVCNENYEAMTPCLSGRYCSSCNKTVIDFTNKDMVALEEALATGEKVCGRFRKEQVTNKTKKVFSFKNIAASLFLTLGLSLLNRSLQAQSTKDSNTMEFPPQNDSLVSMGEIVGEDYFPNEFPEYKHGGNTGLMNFLQKNIQFPTKDTIYGKVLVSISVDKAGKVTNAHIIRSLSKEADLEVLRVVYMLEFVSSKSDIRQLQIPVKFTRDMVNDK